MEEDVDVSETITAAERMDQKRQENRAIYAMTAGRFSTVDEFAQLLYAAYGEHAEWRTFDGNGMLSWQELPDTIRGHWRAVATRAARELG